MKQHYKRITKREAIARLREMGVQRINRKWKHSNRYYIIERKASTWKPYTKEWIKHIKKIGFPYYVVKTDKINLAVKIIGCASKNKLQ